jgi:hypothetical protein
MSDASLTSNAMARLEPGSAGAHEGGGARASGPQQPAKASDLLEELLEAFPNERITVRDLMGRLERRAIGLLLLILALPVVLPNIPGLSTIFGILILVPAVQMTFGLKKLWLPRKLADLTVEREHLRIAIRGALPILRRIETWVRPRLENLTQPPFTIWLGLQAVICALILILPIPLGNMPPGAVVAMTALALLQRDGILALLTLPMFLVSLALVRLGIAVIITLAQGVPGIMAEFTNWLVSLWDGLVAILVGLAGLLGAG